MKNRLQIRYHIPESLPTRAQAMTYLKEAFAIGRTNSTNASLPAEPLVLLYNDMQVDASKGITEAKRLETSNVLLAIGRGGDGTNVFNNQDYFVIDFAKHEEEIVHLNKNVEGIQDIITEIQKTIGQMKDDIKQNADDIASIIKKIGEKGDQKEKDTVYGYIQGAYDAIKDEVNRAEDAEQDLANALSIEISRATGEESRIESVLTQAIESESATARQAEKDLQSHIDTEASTRENKDNELQDLINTEVTRATGKETEILSKLDAEIARSTEKDGKLESDITALNNKLDSEISKREDIDASLQSQISSEIEERKTSDNELQRQITSNLRDITTNASDIAKNKVKSDGKTIIVTGPTTNGTNLEVNVDGKTIVTDNTGRLSVDANTLIKGENAIVVSDVVGTTKTVSLKINENDKVLTNDSNGLLATLSLKWVRAEVDGEKDEIQLIGYNNNIISRIDVADFIKDGMLEYVILDTETNPDSPTLVFTFNSASGKETLRLPVRDLVDIYHAGDGVLLDSKTNTFSVVIDKNSEFLSLSPSGVKVSGITDKINTEVEKIGVTLTALDEKITKEISDRVNNGIELDNAIREDFEQADSLLRLEFQSGDTALQTAINTVNADLIKEIGDRTKDVESLNTLVRTSLADTLTSAQTYTDKTVLAEKTRAEAVEQELATKISTDTNSLNGKIDSSISTLDGKIATNTEALSVLNSAVSVGGSVKDAIFNASLGNIVNTLDVEGARQQSLLRKFTLEGKPYIYVSDVTTDMKHNGDALNNVIDTLRADLDGTMNNTSELLHNVDKLTDKVNEHTATIESIEQTVATHDTNLLLLQGEVNTIKTDIQGIKDLIAPMQATIELLQKSLEATQTNLATTIATLETLKTTAITDINGTANEITVSKSGNTATVGFASDAYFVAGI